MATNIRLYPLYRALHGLLFWMPVFFLYFASVLDAGDVLLLEAIYYLGVVVAEVPSGYFSDRIGRRVTLLIATGAWTVACAVFAATASFTPFVVAQLLLAIGMAFHSGTDSALLYDSLAELGRESEIATHEARAQTWGLVATAFAAVAGGLLAGLDLRIAYVLSASSALGAFAVVLRMKEPPRVRALPPFRQLGAVAARLRDPTLRWVFVLVVAMTVFNHVPYELMQPWLDVLLEGGEHDGRYSATPAVAGVIIGVSSALSAWASARAPALQARIGAHAGLLAALVLQSAVMAAMALAVHPALVPFLLLRSVAQALMAPISLSVIHPRLASGQRATYLSVQSLAGRLAFALSLFAAAAAVGATERMDHEAMREVLLVYLAVAGAVGIGLAAARLFAR